MIRYFSVFCALAACAIEPAPELGTAAEAVVAPEGQGQHWQGQHWQGQHWQGQHWQGTAYQDTQWEYVALAGATTAGIPAQGAITGSELAVWRLVPVKGGGYTWQQRLPDRVCTWNYTRTSSTCTAVNLAVAPSPLAGTTWVGTFRRPDGTTFEGRIQIGASATALGAVAREDQLAMFALDGHAGAAACPVMACDNPRGCRKNCDLWLYDIRVVDIVDPDDGGAPASICGAGERAIAVPGTYDATGERAESASRFTFGCTGGTLAKCTSWGYRPFGSARKTCDAPGCPTDGALHALVDYHRACLRGAMADYCANGHSFTKAGTLVDVYDYDPTKHAYGFAPMTRGGLVAESAATAFVFESSFDRHGAAQLDHLRYAEETSLEDPARGCPGAFYASSDDALAPWNRAAPAWEAARVSFASTPACAHSEQTLGKWLHRQCSPCTRSAGIPASCTDPHGPGWTSACVAAAASCTAAQRMAVHGECVTGAALAKLDSGCTLEVCRRDARCCTQSWDAACVSLANAACRGGSEGRFGGFCSAILPPLPGVER